MCGQALLLGSLLEVSPEQFDQLATDMQQAESRDVAATQEAAHWAEVFKPERSLTVSASDTDEDRTLSSQDMESVHTASDSDGFAGPAKSSRAPPPPPPAGPVHATVDAHANSRPSYSNGIDSALSAPAHAPVPSPAPAAPTAAVDVLKEDVDTPRKSVSHIVMALDDSTM